MQLTIQELEQVKADPTDEVMLRRLCIILALKQAYIRAIGQPLGFDYSRLDFDVPGGRAQGDRAADRPVQAASCVGPVPAAASSANPAATRIPSVNSRR